MVTFAEELSATVNTVLVTSVLPPAAITTFETAMSVLSLALISTSNPSVDRMWNASLLPRATGVDTKPDATVRLGSVIDG